MAIFVGTNGNDSIDGSAADDTINGNDGNDTLNGLAGADQINGGAGNDVLNGGAGNDTLDGGTGADTMNGGSDNDTFVVDNAGDVIGEATGGGFDTVNASVSYALTVGAEVEVMNATNATGGIALTGNGFAQVINGSAGNDVLVGGRNSNPVLGDTLNGGAGNDTFVVTNVFDVLNGGAGVDTAFVSVGDLEAQGQAVATYSLAAGSGVEVLSAQNQQGTENLRLNGSTDAGETIVGNFGANTLSGGGGGDTLIGLNGNDTYVINSANDFIMQETGGTDTVTFGAALGTFNLGTNSPSAAIERVVLNNGTNNVTGNSVAQTLDASGVTAGGATMNGGGGMDSYVGHAGNDLYIVDMDGESISGVVGGSDFIGFNGTSGGYNIAGNLAIAGLGVTDANGVLLGSNGDINGAAAGTPGVYLVGSTASQTILGAGGNDILDGDRGATTNADSLAGGAGDDIYRVYNQSDLVSEEGFTGTLNGVITGTGADAGGNDTIYTSANYSLTTNAGSVGPNGGAIENLIAADASSTVGLALTGWTNSNQITGAAGNDTLNGGAGGTDTLTGLGGNDTYVINAATDVIQEAVGGGTDTVTFGAGMAGPYVLNAGAEIEVINMSGGVTDVKGNEFAQRINGATGAVDEILRSGSSGDTLAGGGGNDVYWVGHEGVTIIDNQGGNFVGYNGTGGGFNLGSQASAFQINGASATGDIYLVGNNDVQTIIGNGGDNILNGAGGLDGTGQGDTLIGGAGNDTYRVFNSNFNGTATASGQGDSITENAGEGTDTVYTSTSYVLQANVENLIAADQVFQTNLTLIGNAGNNSISGSAGNNVIAGGAGIDFLTGLGGADTFHFAHTGAANADTIQDFNAAQGDKISLDANIFAGFGSTVDGAEFQEGTIATGSQATILYDQATGRLFYDADGAGGADAVLFAQLSPGSALSANDFVLTPGGTIPTPQP